MTAFEKAPARPFLMPEQEQCSAAGAANNLDPGIFRIIQDATPDGVMAFASVRNKSGQIRDFRWIYTNPAGEQVVGRTHADLYGKYLLQEMPGTLIEGLFDAFVHVVETGQVWQREFSYHHENLSSWFRSKAVRVDDGFAVTFTDIGKTKQDELQRRLNEQRLRLALQVAQMDSWDWDMEANELVLSNYAIQLFQLHPHAKYTLEDILQRVNSSDQDYVASTFIASQQNGHDLDLEFRLLSQNNPIWVALRGTSYQDAHAKPHMTGVVRDITERRNFEERQQFQIDAGHVFAASLDYQTTIEQTLSLIVPRIADWCCIYTLDENGHIKLDGALHRNPALTEHISRLNHLDTDAQGNGGLMQVLQKAETLFYPAMNRDFCETIDPSSVNAALLSDLGCQSLILAPLLTHGEIIGALSVAMGHSGRQYTEKDRHMVEALAHSMAVALENASLYSSTREAVRIREAFLSIAAHELRNPLTALSGQAQLMQRRMQRDPEASEQDQRTVGIIVDQSNRLNKMIASLLDISKLERGEQQFEFYDLEMCSFLQRIMITMQASLEKHQLVYHGTQGPLFISADMGRMEQVLQNLLTNAVKYSPGGGDILVSIQHNTSTLQISISDAGIGIPQSSLPNLFRQFYRASNAANYASGLGIGLYIVREIIMRHGGHITVESVEGQGSTFRIFLPLMQPQPALDDL